MIRTRIAVRALTVAALLALTACGATIPTDPDGTLDRVRGGVLRAGVSENPPWTEVPPGVEDGEAVPSGPEPELIEAFAESLDATVEWTVGGEEALMGDLAEHRLDVVVGGFTASSPWSSHAGLTLAYVTVPSATGKPEGHVMAVPMGENAFHSELERFLLAQDVRP